MYTVACALGLGFGDFYMSIPTYMDAAYHCRAGGRELKRKNHLFAALSSQDSPCIIEYDELIGAFYLFMLTLSFAEHYQR